jgi:hypothetical protein
MVATSPASARAEPDTAPPHEKSDTPGIRAIGGPVWVAWREGTLTRAKELAALCEWVTANAEDHQAEDPHKNGHVLADAIRCHLEAAKQAACAERLDPNRHLVLVRRVFRNGPLIERAMSNLDAAEAQLLNLAPASYVLGQMPSLLRHVQCHLPPADPARQEFERIARSLGINHPDHPNPGPKTWKIRRTRSGRSAARSSPRCGRPARRASVSGCACATSATSSS